MNKYIRVVLLSVTALAITVSAFVYPQPVLRILPLYISLVVMLLQSRANRYCFLLGSLNSIIYTVAYVSLNLYGLALYAFFFSFPLQIFTFIRWNRQAYGRSTVLRRLTARQRVKGIVGCIAVWLILYAVLSRFGSGYLILDNTVTIIGIAGTVCSLLSLIEFAYLQILSGLVSCVLYICMLNEKPAQITYLIYTIYALLCSVLSLRYMHMLYRKQQVEKTCSYKG